MQVMLIRCLEVIISDDKGAFVLQSGMDSAQLATTARICLGTGYRTDDMDVTLGSALLLVAPGETPYAELMGHHLNQGFGATARPDLAIPMVSIRY